MNIIDMIVILLDFIAQSGRHLVSNLIILFCTLRCIKDRFSAKSIINLFLLMFEI